MASRLTQLKTWLAATLAVLGMTVPVVTLAADGALAQVAQGRVRGVVQGQTVAFLGIPYAQAPVGPLRWRAPLPARPWRGVREATQFGPACWQDPPMANFGPYTQEFVTIPAVDEDCLSLNIWAPAAALATKAGARALPVWVWIHGGGFQGGAGAVPLYDGAALAAQGVVVVTVNYRLGVLGFLSHAQLRAESAQQVSGNYGLLDQIAALRWVKHNIARFGGDARRVVIGGQSAGAASVLYLVAAPQAKGLFAGAVAQSGLGIGLSALPLAETESAWQASMQAAGIPSIKALRALSADEVQKRLRPRPLGREVSGLEAWPYLSPVVDGHLIGMNATEPPAGAKLSSAVPLITGFNADEGFLMGPPRVTPAAFEQWAKDKLGRSAEALLALYPHADEAEATDSLRLLARDRYMAALIIHAERVAAVSRRPVWTYLFDHPYPGSDPARFGAFHSAEVPYVFGNLRPAGRPLGDADLAVSRQLQAHWLQFLRTGHPDGPGLAAWPALSPGRGDVMGLGDHVGMRPAVSTPERMRALRDHVARGGRLALF